MGKLKLAIETLKKDVEALEKEVVEAMGNRKAFADSYLTSVNFCRAGAETIYMYLKERFSAKKEKIEDHMKDTIKTLLDSNMAKMVKGVEDARKNLVAHVSKAKKIDEGVASAVAMATKADATNKKLAEMITKRKKSWLKSAKYKAKLVTYEAANNELAKALREIIASIKKKTNVIGKHAASPDDWKYSASTTLADIFAGCGTYLNADLSMTAQEDAEQVKKFRGSPFSKQLETLKKWSAEADTMESESEEG